MFNETTYDLALSAGCSPDQARIASAIAMAESSGNPRANLVTGREDSRGLWQINTYAHPQYRGVNLYDPATNAAAMFSVSRGCTNWRPWTTYTSGAYQRFLSPLQSPAVMPGGSQGGNSGAGGSLLPTGLIETLTAPVSLFSGAEWLPIALLLVGAYFFLK